MHVFLKLYLFAAINSKTEKGQNRQSMGILKQISGSKNTSVINMHMSTLSRSKNTSILSSQLVSSYMSHHVARERGGWTTMWSDPDGSIEYERVKLLSLITISS